MGYSLVVLTFPRVDPFHGLDPDSDSVICANT